MPIFLVSFCIFFSSLSFATPIDRISDTLLNNGERIEYQNKIMGGSHQIILSAPKRINNELFLEKEKRVNNELNTALIQLTSAYTLSEYFYKFESFLNENGSLKFQCQQRACGVNSYWANNIFDERRLSGRDSDQYYIAGTIKNEGVNYWFTAYLVSNALRQNLVYITYSKQEQEATVWANGYMVPASQQIPDDVLHSLAKRLEDQPELDLFVAAYVDGKRISSVGEMNKIITTSFQDLQNKLSNSLPLDLSRIYLHFTGGFHTESSIDSSQVWFRLFLFSK